MTKKPVQYFTREYLERCKGMTPDQIIEYLENFRVLASDATEKCQLISLKIEPSLLDAFKQKTKLEGIPYQTQIKKLMKIWLMGRAQQEG